MGHDHTSVIENLTGSFLLSTMKMPDPRFSEQVIYICAHNEAGTMGLAINKISPIFTLDQVLKGANLPIPPHSLPPVHLGGPVETESAFILYGPGYQTQYQLGVSETVFLSRETKILEDIAKSKGPEKYLFILGYAGWGPGQLENELLDEGWLAIPSDDRIIFDIDNNEKWQTAAMRYGIDISVFGDIVGNA